MKGMCFKLRMLGIASVVLFCLFVFAGQAIAEGYLGEFCWEVVDDGDTTVLRLGVKTKGSALENRN
jgi:hypothetical protein